MVHRDSKGRLKRRNWDGSGLVRINGRWVTDIGRGRSGKCAYCGRPTSGYRFCDTACRRKYELRVRRQSLR